MTNQKTNVKLWSETLDFNLLSAFTPVWNSSDVGGKTTVKAALVAPQRSFLKLRSSLFGTRIRALGWPARGPEMSNKKRIEIHLIDFSIFFFFLKYPPWPKGGASCRSKLTSASSRGRGMFTAAFSVPSVFLFTSHFVCTISKPNIG